MQLKIQIFKTVIYILPVLVYSCIFTKKNFRHENLQTSFFGEKTHLSGPFCQYANGISSYFFVLSGIPSLLRLQLKKKQENFERCLFLLVCTYITLGNLSYHAFCLPTGLDLDASGMIFMISYFCSHTIKKLFFSQSYKIRKRFFWCYFFLSIGLLDPFMGNLVDAKKFYEAIIPVICGIEIMYANSIESNFLPNIFGIISAVSMALGYTMWRVEQNKKSPLPENSWFQLHALWHFFTAVTCMFLQEMYNHQNKNLYNSNTITENEATSSI